MEKDHLVITRKPGLKCRTLYRVAAVGIATLITQASPGGAASSWGVDCLTTNLANNSYCVTSLLDDIPDGAENWTLRKSVEDANTRAVPSATIGFQDATVEGAAYNNTAKLVLNSTLEIKTNITITAPTDSGGSPLLTIVRGDSVASGAPLIAINPSADAHPATPTTGPAANQATTEVKIENVIIQARTNPENPQGSMFAGQTQEFANSGVTIQVKETISETSTGPVVITPTVVLVNTTISNAVSESGGAAISTSGDITLVNSNLTGNVAAQSGPNAVTQDGGAIKAEGTVNVISSALNGNTATGNGGAISATSVIVSTAEGSSNSQLNNNTAGESGGAISAAGDVAVTSSVIAGNEASAGNGGAISATGVSSTVAVANSGLVSNTASGNGGAISATGATSTVEVTNSGLGNNTAGGNGGAISASGTTGAVSVTNSSLGLNTAGGNGGAIAAGGAVNVSSSSVLVANSATSGNGGAITSGGDVTIANSGLASNTASGDGGAISSTGATSAVEVTNSGLGNNTAGGNGGAISASGTTGAVRITNSSLGLNTATTGDGGAIAVTGASSSVSITNSGLGYNFATTGDGGAIAAKGATSTVQIMDSSIAENGAGKDGGGISSGGEVTIGSNSSTPVNAPTTGSVDSALAAETTSEASESTFSASTSISLTLGSNVYSTSAGQGNSGSSDSATNPSGSIMFKNTAASGSGGAISAKGEVTVTSGTNIYNNTASVNGGAISAESKVTVVNSAVSSNTATEGSGGAISTLAGVAVSDTSTFSNNTAEVNGGAITAGGDVTVSASTLNNNTATEGSGGAISAAGKVTVSNSEFIENVAMDEGGAIYGESEVIILKPSIPSEKTYFTENSADFGGAIYAGDSVKISDANFEDNTAEEAGGAIFISTDSEEKSSISYSTFESNFGGIGGGAIVGSSGKLVINSSDFINNTSLFFGGAVVHGVALEVNSSTFTGNIASLAGTELREIRDECAAQENQDSQFGQISCFFEVSGEFLFLGMGDGGYFPYIGMGGLTFRSGGGAIYIENTEYYSGDIVEISPSMMESDQDLNNEQSSITQVVAIHNSEFSQNSAQGDGGAIFFLGLLQILGSRFEENWALPAFIQVSNDPDPVYELIGSGGAVYGEKVEITASTFNANIASVDGGALYADESLEIFESLPQPEKTYSTEFENNFAIADIFSDPYEYEGQGGGGAIAASGSVTVTDSLFKNNFTTGNGGAINYVDGTLIVKDSAFDGNSAYENGGAIYALGELSISGSTFGVMPEVNPDYNPIIGFISNPQFDPNEYVANPNYNPYISVPNPEFNPMGTVNNPSYNISVPSQLLNPNYNVSVPRLLRNPDCPSGSTIYDGEDYGNGPIYACEYVIDNGDGTISFASLPLYIANPQYDDRANLDNPQYDDRVTIQGLLNPLLPENNTETILVLERPLIAEDTNEVILNPNFNPIEFIDVLQFTDKPGDDKKFNYLGNSSGNDGGAIYVEGTTSIKDSTFNGNLSDDDGGAIYSEGSLLIKDSSFNRNWANDDGGAIRTEPGEGDLFITRTAFIENVAMDDGGAIDISTGPVAHYDDVILSSLFRGNEAFGSGGAIDSAFVVLILNTFEDNTDSQGATLDIGGGALSGNVLIGSSNDGDLCSIYDFVEAADNFATDSSCFESGQSELNTLLTREEITSEVELHILPEGYGASILQAFQSQEEFFLDSPSDSNPEGVLAPLGDFITDNLNKDFDSQVRESTVSWTAGHLQRILPEPPIVPEVDDSVVDKEKDKPKDSDSNSQPNPQPNPGSNNQFVITSPSSNDAEAPVLILDRVLSSEEIARIAQQRAEQLAAELKRQQAAEKAVAERLAKIKADKLARDKARALAAEKRRAQLAALKAKIAATKARGEALKQKNSWINLMKDYPKPAQVKS
jgi:predicted outer membrane repeat protein